jgi:hypothetical protein
MAAGISLLAIETHRNADYCLGIARQLFHNYRCIGYFGYDKR